MIPVLRLARQIALSNVRDLDVPYKLTYALTYRCQFSCSMCNIGRRELQQELTVSEIADFFERSNGFSWVNLSGGEIFLREDLLDIVGIIALQCKGLYVLNFPTNGYLTDLIVDRIGKLSVAHRIPRLIVTVSLDGPPRVHDSIRNMPGSWNRAVETFRRLRKMKNGRFEVYFGMTLQDTNVEEYDAMVASVQERIGDVADRDIHVNVLHTSNHYYRNAGCSIRNKQQVIDRIRTIGKRRNTARSGPVGFLERRYQTMAELYLMTGRTPIVCQALSASLFMDPSGAVYPCTIFDSPIGNIRDHGYALDRLWNAGQRELVRGQILKKDCPQCWTPCEAYQSILANMAPFLKR